MSKYILSVYVDSETKIRTDIPNWDKYGVSEALDFALQKFPPQYFTVNTGKVAQSVTNPVYRWNTYVWTAPKAGLGVSQFPVLAVYDAKTKKLIAKMEGTPRTNQDVLTFLNNVLKPKKSSWSWLALGFLFLIPKTSK